MYKIIIKIKNFLFINIFILILIVHNYFEKQNTINKAYLRNKNVDLYRFEPSLSKSIFRL